MFASCLLYELLFWNEETISWVEIASVWRLMWNGVSMIHIDRWDRSTNWVAVVLFGMCHTDDKSNKGNVLDRDQSYLTGSSSIRTFHLIWILIGSSIACARAYIGLPSHRPVHGRWIVCSRSCSGGNQQKSEVISLDDLPPWDHRT